ncbi:cytochrome o ubiquinol oxidase subunit IV [Sulfuriferula sp.]|uniref:cytochrome o ubiquinol oxidase subunit IV n=1 Tax=Sulfuriferula sp. TaxID=2025307 RepID=UPI00272FF023|nr:cytochrome o ubiquinol oxidase subunit IV [Sulfuriferula sp.]MDP2024641.1 cytochrome o ubiquinol oxidase subunit IV [Sulfuriferula sp.]
MTHDSIDLPGVSHARLRTYVVGFALSIVLTAIPFGLVVFGLDRFPHIAILIAIALAAIVQIVVQLHYFLHLDRTSDQSWNLLAIVFTVLIIAIMLLGTLWIMFDLHARMM